MKERVGSHFRRVDLLKTLTIPSKKDCQDSVLIVNIDQAGVIESIKAFTADAGYLCETNVAVPEQHTRVDGR